MSYTANSSMRSTGSGEFRPRALIVPELGPSGRLRLDQFTARFVPACNAPCATQSTSDVRYPTSSEA